jgi:hypothetical protein
LVCNNCILIGQNLGKSLAWDFSVTSYMWILLSPWREEFFSKLGNAGKILGLENSADYSKEDLLQRDGLFA